MKELTFQEVEAISNHFWGILNILTKPKENLDIPEFNFEVESNLNTPVSPIVSWDDICGNWSYNQENYKELSDKIPSPFTIFKESDGYFITFDDKRELMYRLEEIVGGEGEGLFCFFIESCYFKLTYNPDVKGIYIIPYFNYYKRKED